jgi:hypothetical protein
LAAVVIVAAVLVGLLTKKQGQSTDTASSRSSYDIDEIESSDDSQPLSEDLFE